MQKNGPRKSDGPPAAGGIGITKKVGGWVFGKWGATPAPAPVPEASRPTSSNSQQTQSSANTATASAMSTHSVESSKKKPEKGKLRPSGVNQNGPIWGFFDIPETPTRVVVQDYDAEALGEALAEMQQ